MLKYFVILSSIVSSLLPAEEFHAAVLPNGTDVTVPGNTQTLVELSTRVTLSSTENIQTVRFSPIGIQGKIPTVINLAIFDQNQSRVKYIKIAPTTPFLYSFKKMSSIAVVPQKINSSTASQTILAIESDKALKISR